MNETERDSIRKAVAWLTPAKTRGAVVDEPLIFRASHARILLEELLIADLKAHDTPDR